MKKLFTLLLTSFICYAALAQQQILLLTETFEGPTTTFNFDTGGVGTNTGNNAWIINNQYTGAPVYGVTPPQDSIVSGTINGAPNSKYLHIHDQAAVTSNSVSNCNWNTNTASDRFAFIGSPFCTLGMTNVTFTFFWICEGVPANAYGEVYYRIDGGPWTKTGQTEYANQNKWKYEIIQDPAFNNVQNLQLGFRWVNGANGGTSNISFGIDDIIAVGTYDEVNNSTQISINYLSSTNVCQGDDIVFSLNLSNALCDGQYYIELSDANGNFGANPGVNQYINLYAPDTVTYVSYTIPNNLAGNCYKLRWHRQGTPDIIGQASVCLAVTDCPETITTVSAPVMNDADTTCLLSVIDVKFNSIGVFGPGNSTNVYKAQLSDANGSFASPTQLGTLTSDESYPAMPGTVSGLIPASVPPGCGYYIRVVSTIPAITGSLIGPFCLTQCDELTNDHEDLSFCIQSGPAPLCDSIKIHPNEWNTQASYDTCNNWTVELRSMMNFALVNSGGLAVYHDSVGGNFQLCMPVVRELLPVAPGAYYLRIVSNCSNQAWNQTGSVIRITIGAPDTLPPTILFDDSVACNQGQVQFLVNPFNHPPSDYIWNSNFLAPAGGNVGDPFTWNFNPLTVNITPGTQIGDYVIYVREKNFGCLGPYSAAGRFTLINTPSVQVSGPLQVCLGDTVSYFVNYLKETYYNWDAPDGVTILDEANSTVRVIFDTLGTFDLTNFSLNKCGSDSGTLKVKVVTLFNVNAGADQQVCEGDTVKLNGVSGDLDKFFVTSDTANGQYGKPGAMFNIIAHSDVIIDSFAVKYSSAQPVQAEIYRKPGTYKTFEQLQFSWNNPPDGYFNFPPSPVGQFTVIPIFVNQSISAGDTFGFYITTRNTSPIINQAVSPTNGPPGSVYKTDGIIDFVQGTANSFAPGNEPFGAISARVLNLRIYYSTKAGLSYLWNTGDTSATLVLPNAQNGSYNLIVYDTSGCRNRDTVLVTVNPAPVVNAGTDTLICGGNGYVMNGTSNAANVEWTPSTGLSNINTLNPVWNNSAATTYYLTGTDAIGCKNTDSVFINVIPISVNAGADTTLCDGETFTLQASSSTATVLWTPATGLSAVDILNPQFNNTEGAEYILIGTDTSGCVLSDTVTIGVGPCQSYIKVPGAFTPNGTGENNFFTVFGKNIGQYEIRIYNRWGELVYNSRNLSELNDLNGGWDGTYQGKPQQIGTFVYYITARDLGNKLIEKKGNLTLIR